MKRDRPYTFDRWLVLTVCVAVLWTHPSHATDPSLFTFGQEAGAQGTHSVRIVPTVHPGVPQSADAMWYVPRVSDVSIPPAVVDLARGVRMLEENGDAAAALPLVSHASLAKTDVADYAQFYTGIALQRLNRLPEAEAAFAAVAEREPEGFLAGFASYKQADVREARGDFAGALAIQEKLFARPIVSPEAVWLKIATLSAAAGDQRRAIDAHRKILYEYPLSTEAVESETALDRLQAFDLSSAAAAAAEVTRAEALFKARRWDQAKSAFTRVRNHVAPQDRDLVAIRLAAIDHHQDRHRPARDVFTRYSGNHAFAEIADFHLLGITRTLGPADDYPKRVQAYVARHPSSPFAEEALNDLATYYIRADNDGAAATIFEQMLEKYPSGRFAERAAWKAGWWAYRQKNFRNAIDVFERGAVTFPRSDYRPSWLYWSARAYDQIGDTTTATGRYQLAATDYLNTYYGRLSWRRLEERKEATVARGIRRVIAEPPLPPPGVERIARLIQLELYHPALRELQHVQSTVGDSVPLQATIAFVQHKLGNLRPGITLMKRAYPQFMAAGGEQLPDEILRVMFPLDYWPLIQYHAKARGLDPFLVAALVGQESTFDADIVSAAKAIGLMQVIPDTGARYARKIGITPFSAARLTDPETNVRIGTTYLSELIQEFGAAYFAIASYNAGEHRIARWKRERPDLPQDEFIDDIPYEETRNYVKRILGTAEDYRRLYGNGAPPTTITRVDATGSNGAARVDKPAVTKKSPTLKKATPKKAAKKTTAKKSPSKKAATKKTTPKKTLKQRNR